MRLIRMLSESQGDVRTQNSKINLNGCWITQISLAHYGQHGFSNTGRHWVPKILP